MAARQLRSSAVSRTRHVQKCAQIAPRKVEKVQQQQWLRSRVGPTRVVFVRLFTFARDSFTTNQRQVHTLRHIAVFEVLCDEGLMLGLSRPPSRGTMFQTPHRRCSAFPSHTLVSTQYDEPPIDYSEDEQEEVNYSVRSSTSRHRVPPIPPPHPRTTDLTKYVQLTTRDQLPLIPFDQLRFECLVGQGGFGKVYRAKHNGRCVAIKEPIYYDPSLVCHINEAIVDEALLHYHLSHPNIIQLYGISTKGDNVLLVMEYAQGKSLRELISKRTLSPNVIIKFAIQISSAMEYLHNFQPKAIIHRDLKSPNILLNEPIRDGNWGNKLLKLTDLGLAQEFTHSTKMSQCGTYAWMAPESITESKFSKSSDVWSFGVVLWELLTSQIPYRDFSGPAIAFGIGNGRLTLPIPTTCPEELKCILQACWHQDPKMRPTFTEIRIQLQKSSFNVINLEQFQKMKRNWFLEIENIWQSLKEKEKELESREEEAKRKEAEVEKMQRFLKQQSEELRRREIEVVSRELNVLLQQQQQVPKHEVGKRPKRRVPRKKLVASSSKIGYPQNFCHNLTITSSQDDHAMPLLQARALNQTWGPGTKLRPELHLNLFSKSRSSSKSQDLDDPENPDEERDALKDGTKHAKVKRIGSFLRRIFGSSKSNLSRVNLKDSAENVDTIDNEDYEQIEGLKLSSRFPRHRTYHGQTKYSERKRLNLYEHFQQQISFDYEDDDDTDQDEEEEDLEMDSQSQSGSRWQPESIACLLKQTNGNCRLRLRENVQDYNNNNNNDHRYTVEEQPYMGSSFYYQSSSRSNSTEGNSKSNASMSTSEQDFDQDLLQEFDRFEQEFQSMNCPST